VHLAVLATVGGGLASSAHEWLLQRLGCCLQQLLHSVVLLLSHLAAASSVLGICAPGGWGLVKEWRQELVGEGNEEEEEAEDQGEGSAKEEAEDQGEGSEEEEGAEDEGEGSEEEAADQDDGGGDDDDTAEQERTPGTEASDVPGRIKYLLRQMIQTADLQTLTSRLCKEHVREQFGAEGEAVLSAHKQLIKDTIDQEVQRRN